MSKKNQLVAASLLLLGFAHVAQGASLSLVPVSSGLDSVVTGEEITLEIVMDFTGEPTLGGALDIVYDPSALGFVSFFRDESIGDPLFSRDPDILTGRLESWGVASFDGLPEVATLGSVTFVVLPTMGAVTTIHLEPTSIIGCTWVDLNNPVFCLDVDYGSYPVSRVPVPAAVWLMLSGLACFCGFRVGSENRLQSSCNRNR